MTCNNVPILQVAVKRHQTECEHRVELEQSKYTALLEQHAVLEKRLATANKSLAALEKQFSEYKAAQRKTVEADLAAQLLVQKQQCSDYKAKFEAAFQSKEEYKTQVSSQTWNCLVAINVLVMRMTPST